MAAVPTVRRRRLGLKLRQLRREAGLSVDDVGESGIASAAKVSRLENARYAAKPEDITALLDLYKVDDPELRTALLGFARDGSQRGWWHSYRGMMSTTYADLVSFESEATDMREWAIAGIPGLLQTPEYARQIIAATAMHEAVAEKVDPLVEVRMGRQAVLGQENAPTFWAIISELALHTQCSGKGVMREQLNKLLATVDRPNVTVQVLPLQSPPNVGLLGAFGLLTFESHNGLDVVYLEHLDSAAYVEEESGVAVYQAAFDRLRASALSPEASAERIEEIRDTTS